MPNHSLPRKVRSYRDLEVWKKSIELVEQIYRATQPFPKREIYGIVKQMRRASVSIPSNIAEGQGRRTTGDFIRFISNAEGSLCELDTQLIISMRLRFAQKRDLLHVFRSMVEIRRMLSALRKSLESRRRRTNTRDNPN